MKTWKEQASKNGLAIEEDGNCQLCGAMTSKGLSECIYKSSMIIHKLEHNLGVKNMTIFLCVDTYALQHSEVHGRWNNHFHLSRLNLILNRKIQWNYKFSSILSHILDTYKLKNENEIIENLELKNRGLITVVDIQKTKLDADYVKIVNKWALEVFEKYVNGHQIVNEISEIFLRKINNK